MSYCMPAAKFEIKRKCSICGEEFLAKTIESWYCSPRCSKIAWKRRKDEEKRIHLSEIKRVRRMTPVLSNELATGKSSVSCPLKPSDSAPLC